MAWKWTNFKPGLNLNQYVLIILKHLREFVQSDWFVPVFISDDRDTAGRTLGMFAPGRIDPLECRDLFLSWKQQFSYYDPFRQILYMRIKVLFLKRDGLYGPI